MTAQSPVFTPAWLDPADVGKWLRVNAVNGDDDPDEINRVCVVAETYAQECRPEFWDTADPPVYAPNATVYQGAVMYAARELRRRNSPAGVESFADVGIVFVSKFDPDIDRAFKTGAFQRPGVG